MKRLISLILLAALMCVACACGAPKDPTVASPTDTEQKPQFTAETLPKIDGSTATIPLSEGIVQDLLGYTPEQAQSFIKHNTTHNAYVNLIAGKCDIIFVTPPSEEEYSMLAEAGNDFEIVRVVKDAFVFLVNAQNPLDNIYLDDLRAIYKGEITSWKDIGGDNLDIIPYQRPDNSGSQTLMYKLVLDRNTIMEAPTSLRPTSMGDLVDVVSDFTAGRGALGYSVYYYATGMYVDAGSKLISVNNVYPNRETIADDSYPLVDGYYAIYRKPADETSSVSRLVKYLLSPAGQLAAEVQGYVPLS